VGKPHGLAGEVYVVRISDDPLRFEPGASLIHDRKGELVIDEVRGHNDRLLVKFRGIDTREQAEGLRGALFVTPDDLRELDESEFWEHDLVGLTVVTSDGSAVGEVTAVINGPQDLLEVSTNTGLRYVPVVKEIVVAVDLEAGRITLDPPAGLLD
jgi:16S rRNA processing protein RimM